MAGVPYKGGFTPLRLGNASQNSGQIRTFQTSAAAGPIFEGDPVFLNANGLVEAGITPTSTTNVIGVAQGSFWIDPTNRQPVESKFKPDAQAVGAGEYNGIRFTDSDGPGVKVVMAGREQLFAVKANTSIPQTALGNRVELNTSTAGSTVTGISGATITATSDATSPVVVADIFKAEDYIETPTSAGGSATNDWGADETIVAVQLRNVGE